MDVDGGLADSLKGDPQRGVGAGGRLEASSIGTSSTVMVVDANGQPTAAATSPWSSGNGGGHPVAVVGGLVVNGVVVATADDVALEGGGGVVVAGR